MSNVKEKAIELVCKFSQQIPSKYNESYIWIKSIRCAIIAVDEILKDDLIVNNQDAFEYYFEVKQQLEEML